MPFFRNFLKKNGSNDYTSWFRLVEQNLNIESQQKQYFGMNFQKTS